MTSTGNFDNPTQCIATYPFHMKRMQPLIPRGITLTVDLRV